MWRQSGLVLWKIYRAKEIHGNQYDYSNISRSDIINSNSRVIIGCLSCCHKWSVSVHEHMDQRNYGCPNCVSRVRWTLDRFIENAQSLHNNNNRYDYSHLADNDIVNSYRKFPVKCKTCNNTWNVNIITHIHKMCGCPRCF